MTSVVHVESAYPHIERALASLKMRLKKGDEMKDTVDVPYLERVTADVGQGKREGGTKGGEREKEENVSFAVVNQSAHLSKDHVLRISLNRSDKMRENAQHPLTKQPRIWDLPDETAPIKLKQLSKREHIQFIATSKIDQLSKNHRQLYRQMNLVKRSPLFSSSVVSIDDINKNEFRLQKKTFLLWRQRTADMILFRRHKVVTYYRLWNVSYKENFPKKNLKSVYERLGKLIPAEHYCKWRLKRKAFSQLLGISKVCSD